MDYYMWLWTSLYAVLMNIDNTVGVDKPPTKVLWEDYSLPEEHIPAFFHNNPNIKRWCKSDDSCPYKSAIEPSKEACWGYEKDCLLDSKLPHCPEHHENWVKSKEDQRKEFWKAADFGYVKHRQTELRTYCTPSQPGDSSLRCSDHLQFCQATNIYIDFSTAALATSTNQYRMDVLGPGQIGGHCDLDRIAVNAQLDHMSPLQSWAPEMEHFTSYPFYPITDKKCDIVISKPTYLIKLDATVNMYHHFCDYVNLYASQHINNSFSKDVVLILWDTSGHTHTRMFSETWKAYSKHPPIYLNQLDKKKVCIKDAVFSLLARMRRGLYYNMPLIPGCYGSELIRAFSHHIIHRLDIPQHGPLENKVRVTLLARSTQFRQILNQKELLEALRSDVDFEVHKVDYIRTIPFVEQLEVTHNSDIFIGMHGAGLTHMLFQPDWGVVIELYNCEDASCYLDLARLRGVKYMTWENQDKLMQEDEGHHPTLGAHAKFTNYGFDVEEFMRLIRKARDHVKSHPAFIAAHKKKYPHVSTEETAGNEKSAEKQGSGGKGGKAGRTEL